MVRECERCLGGGALAPVQGRGQQLRQNRRIDRFDDVVIETSSFGSPPMLFLAITGYRDDQGRPIPRLGSNAFGYLVPIHSR